MTKAEEATIREKIDDIIRSNANLITWHTNNPSHQKEGERAYNAITIDKIQALIKTSNAEAYRQGFEEGVKSVQV
jgi:putative NIF3 family GTP cyclohydrolase 1 type 2